MEKKKDTKNQLTCDLIAKILELAFIIITATNLKAISYHLCCDMDSAVITMVVLFSLLSVCVLFQIILDVTYLTQIKKEKKNDRS